PGADHHHQHQHQRAVMAPGDDRPGSTTGHCDLAEPVVRSRRFRVMNADAHAIVVDGSSTHLDAVEAGLADRERRWSRFRPDSELSRLNQASGRPVILSADTFTLVAAAVSAHAATGGTFDPTVLRCLEAAGYDRSFADLPAAPPPVTHRPSPGPDGIQLLPEASMVILPEGVGLDLGGIAKGAAVEAVVEEIMAGPVEADRTGRAGRPPAGVCVNVGGDLVVAGRPPQAEGWRVALETSYRSDRLSIRLAAGAVCTSATTKRRWRSTAGAEHHLRAPATGAPLDTGLCSVTVIAARATQAEVLTKAALAAGPEHALALLAGYGVTGILVGDDGAVIRLPGFDRFAGDDPSAWAA
ncbi:MAG: FAD:protein FMN transferase, partial [Acidimicrobiales bacterium]